MREYFPKVGSRGLDMMRRTATAQVNLDYADEQDAMRKLRVALKLSPVATAIFANSPVSEGAANGLKSERALVWLDTDPDRTGLLPMMMEEGASFASYAKWALEVPMYLFKRDGEVIANTGQTFRSFWQDGFDGHRACRSDWGYHLNTLFPEVRLQKTIEVRSADSLPRQLLPAVPALWAGLLYDDTLLAACERLTRAWTHEQLEAARPDIARRGLGADLAGSAVRSVAELVVELAMAGLARRARLDAEGRDERIHLEPIAALVANGLSPADQVLAAVNGSPGDRDVLIAAMEI